MTTATAPQQSDRTALVSALPRVRRADAADTAVLADLYTRCLDRAFDSVNIEFSRMAASAKSANHAVRAALADPEAVVMIAHLGNRPAGFAIARNGRLDAIGVIPAERGRGLGAVLFRNINHALPRLTVRTPVATEFFANVTGKQGQVSTDAMVEIGSQGFLGGKVPVREFRVNTPHYS